ncbi:uncharacterized protein SAPINGB_P004749 [Magnusiomyces paraingens]|uniref:FZ domain-containing protein n=1 Tax=Magnusiomyces paraingens TaxID=2606893 RepID=A0A5E8BYU4_9ASCO|nr:uncharacterized protein SAPINGB_P004749 [Saprochaete ingens]VVT55809.1 unnamed protein product [Saprochaete ingens]
MLRPVPALTLFWVTALALVFPAVVAPAQALDGTRNNPPTINLQNLNPGLLLEDEPLKPGYYAAAVDRVQLLPRVVKDSDDSKKDSDGDSDSDSDNDSDNNSKGILDPPSKSVASLSSATDLPNNTVLQGELSPGDYHVYHLTNVSSAAQTAFFTANLCSAPAGDTGNISNSVQIQVAASLTDLTSAKSAGSANYTAVSLDSDVMENPDSDDYLTVSSGVISWYTGFYMGFSNLTVLATNISSLYIMIRAGDNIKNISSSDSWTYQLGASTAGPLHEYSSGPNLYLVDTDFAHALLVTDGMTDQKEGYENMTFYEDLDTYYDIHVFVKSAGDALATRLGGSYCAMSSAPSQLLNRGNADISVTTRGNPAVPKLQYFMSGLNMSTDYSVFLTRAANPDSEMGAGSNGGTAFPGVSMRTNAEQNCQIVYDLEFCSDVAYAVPGNASAFTPLELGEVYDAKASGWYGNFNKSLQQVSCDIRTMEQYSILRTCEDCATSYRQWLCSVTIPRCMDATSPGDYLTLRAVNSSRASFIDEIIRPGPYKELLPCIGMCDALVQDCPASMGFACPKVGQIGFEGYYMSKANDGSVQCNFPGAVYRTSGGVRIRSSVWGYLVILFVCLSIL